MLTNPQISEFPMNSDKISRILTEFLSEFWCSKVRSVRSLPQRRLCNSGEKALDLGEQRWAPWHELIRSGAGPRSPRVERFGRRPTEPFELLNIRIRIEILSQFRKFCQNSSEIQKFEDLSTCSKLFIEILRKFHWNWCKIRWKLLKNRDFCWNLSKIAFFKQIS